MLRRSKSRVLPLLAISICLPLAPVTAQASTSMVVAPAADTYVHEYVKATNYGGSWSLAAYGSPNVESYLRFALPAAPSGQVLSGASLRVRTTSTSSAGSANTQQVRQVPDTWVENTVTWNTKPTVFGPVFGSLTGATAISTRYDIALDTTALSALLGTTTSLAVVGTGSDSFWFTSREHGTVADRPSLTLIFSASSSPDTSAPTAPTSLQASVSSQSVALSWAASTDNVAVTGYDVHRSATADFTPAPATRVGSVAGTSFEESSVATGTWYYRVVAKDAAGNQSPASAPASAVVSGSTTTSVTVTPTADVYVHQYEKTTNYGSSWSLAAYGSPNVESYLRFTLPAAGAGQVLSGASLRVRTTGVSSAGSADVQQVRQAADTWAETTVNWNTKPAVFGSVLGSLSGATAITTRYDIALDTATVAALLGKTGSLAVLGTGTDSFWFTSRETSTAADRPTLTLRFTTNTDTTAPTAPTGLSASAVGNAAIDLSWAASSDNVGVVRYQVHRSPNAGFTPAATTLIASPTSVSYTDPARPAGTAYYRVIAVDAAGNLSAPSNQATAVVTSPSSVTVFAVGDIACAPGAAVTTTTCRHRDVASVVGTSAGAYLVTPGDLQYNSGTYAEFTGAGGFDSTFGSFKARTLPVLGNHEFSDPNGPGKGFFDYFYGQGVAQGPFGARGDGYYTQTVGGWQFIGLNSECAPDSANGNRAVTGGCGPGSPQYQWLESVLGSSTARCTLVAFHRPRWTTGGHPSYAAMGPMWDLMVSAGVDVAVSGHNHSSEVFQRIGASGTGSVPALDSNGIRSFVAGGGGKSLYSFVDSTSAVRQALHARDSTTFGPLQLTLRDGSFDWAFQPIAGRTFTNVGTTGAFSGAGEPCH